MAVKCERGRGGGVGDGPRKGEGWIKKKKKEEERGARSETARRRIQHLKVFRGV